MREVAKALGDDPGLYENILASQHQYRSTIANKAALIVVDDVWSKAEIEPLLAESPRSRFLFTTRNSGIAKFVGARQCAAELLDPAQSRKLLAAWAGLDSERLPSEANDVIAECGRLPLALSVVGAMLRNAGSGYWQDTLKLLREVDLSAIEELLPPGQESFFRAVETSFRVLEQPVQERYKALAVLLDNTTAPLQIVATLWHVSEAEARRTCRRLIERSLAQGDGEDQGLRLHTLQLDYVRAQWVDRDALTLIHDAVRLSSNAIQRDPNEFVSQLTGRLAPHERVPAIQEFIRSLAQGTRNLWLRPLSSALHPPGTALVRTLQGHSDRVNGVAMTSDARSAVSASNDRTLKVWDLETGRELFTLRGHASHVWAVATTSDGRRAVSASNDQTLKLWDLKTGHELFTLEGHHGAVCGVGVSADGRRAVSASWDSTLKVWDLETGSELFTLLGHSHWVSGVVLSPDGCRGVSASHDKTLKVWDLQTGRQLHELVGHDDVVSGAAMTSDGRLAVSASRDKTLRVWDLETGHERHTLTGHHDSVFGVAMTSDGRLAISASRGQNTKSLGFNNRPRTAHTSRTL
jgi:WD40 repeat protein